MNTVEQIEIDIENKPDTAWGPRTKHAFNKGGLRRLALERPALLFFLSRGEDGTKRSKAPTDPGMEPTSHGSAHPTVTTFLACFIELERRGYIELRPSISPWSRPGGDGIWATKKTPMVPGSGMTVELFNCISHAYSPVQDIIRKFLQNDPENPWDLCIRIGQREAKAYGYLLRQTWPKAGIFRWLARLGLREETQTVWVRNGLKVRAARQASLILKEHISEFQRRAPMLYKGLCQSIMDGMVLRGSQSAHLTIRLPHLRRRPAH